jgi:hypothetical protein
VSLVLCAVEGHGEVKALPVLLRRLEPAHRFETWRVSPGKIFGGDWSQFEQAAGYARRQSGDSKILLLLDTDCERSRCPRDLARGLLADAVSHAQQLPVGLVLAECEFETWFLAAAVSLRGKRGLPNDLSPPANLRIRGAKEWLSRKMRQRYSETLDQPAFAATMDLRVARARCPSFDKLCRELSRLVA